MEMQISPEAKEAMKHNVGIANDIIAHVNGGAMSDDPIWDKHWNQNWVSVEGDGSEFRGRDAVKAKGEAWMGMMTIHGCTAEGPYVTPNGFCIKYTIDAEAKDGSMPRMEMAEIANYTVEDGKIVREEFFGQPMPGCF